MKITKTTTKKEVKEIITKIGKDLITEIEKYKKTDPDSGIIYDTCLHIIKIKFRKFNKIEFY